MKKRIATERTGFFLPPPKVVEASTPRYCIPFRTTGEGIYPLNGPWQSILEHLYRAKVITTPRVLFDELFHDEPKLFALRLAATHTPTDGYPKMSGGHYSRGVSHDYDGALSKVVGELLERYTLMSYRDADLIHASIKSLAQRKKIFLDPRLADHYAPWQRDRLPGRRIEDTSTFRFVEGVSLTHGKRGLIPAQMVYPNYRLAEQEPVFCESNSSGAGGYFTEEEAILSGLYELIQRDGFLKVWLSQKTPRRIDTASLRDSALQELLEQCARYRLEVNVLDVTSEFDIPIYVTVLVDRTGIGPAIVLGGGCGSDPEKAILRSLTEAIGVRGWLRATRERIGAFPTWEGVEPFTTEWGQQDRLLLWYGSERIDDVAFLLSGNKTPLNRKPTVFDSSKEELHALVRNLSSHGEKFEVFSFIARHHLLRDLTYHSAKVCVPGLLRLYMREPFAPLGASVLAGISVNPLPHPFP